MSDGNPLAMLRVVAVAACAGLAAQIARLAGAGAGGVLEAVAAGAGAIAVIVVVSTLVGTAAGRRRARTAELVDSTTELGSSARLQADLREALAATGPGRQLHLAIFDLEGFKKYNDSYGRACGDALLWRLGRKLEAALAPNAVYRMRGDEYGALVHGDDEVARQAGQAGVRALFESGEGFMIRCAHGTVRLPDEATDVSEALRLADQRVHAERNEARFLGRIDPDDSQIAVLPAAPRFPPPRYDVAALAAAVARRLGLPEAEIDDVEVAAQLRDVGNMAIPDAILQNPGSVSDEEWRFIRFHTLVGERLLGAGFGMHAVARLVRSSHERFDGDGYPDGLSGEEVPLGARVIFVCSAFEDMTAERAHRPALGPQAALAELRRCAGSQFDPRVVEAFGPVFAELEPALERSAQSVRDSS
jgi:diguanylate cyclase (GGDEF)-like protein